MQKYVVPFVKITLGDAQKEHNIQLKIVLERVKNDLPKLNAHFIAPVELYIGHTNMTSSNNNNTAH